MAKRQGSTRSPDAATPAVPSATRHFPVFLLVAFATVAVFARVATFDFISFDDSAYVYANRYVQAPFTLDSLRWAFTTGHEHNWHPVTWLSHMADSALFGLRPGFHHAVNVLFHLSTVLLIYFILRRCTRAPGPSALAACLFAVHPLHVESVAWIAERKDVLSACLGMASLAAYCAYCRRSSRAAYLAACATLATALMSKSMLVSLPFLFLLFDYWPLGRLQRRVEDGEAPASSVRRIARIAIIEKLPFFALAIAAAIVAMVLKTPQNVTPGARIPNAGVAYAWYPLKFVWPAALCAYYPYPVQGFPWRQVALSSGFLIAATVAVCLLRRRSPYLITGWFWYLIALAPASGVVQIGSHLIADRYSYVPLLGLAIMAAWGGADLAARCRASLWLQRSLSAILVATLALLSYRQLGFWRDSVTLYDRALAIAPENSMMVTGIANDLFRKGRYEEALDRFREAARISPGFATIHNNVGLTLLALGRDHEAIPCFLIALALDPNLSDAHTNLATALSKAGRPAEAIPHFRAALQQDPQAPDLRAALAAALAKSGEALVAQGRSADAERELSEAVSLHPADAAIRMDYARVLVRQGKLADAAAQYRTIVQANPRDRDAWFNLAALHEFQKNTADAISALRNVLEIDSADAEARAALIRLGVTPPSQ